MLLFIPAPDVFRVVDNHGRIDVYITTPANTVTMAVEVECDHYFGSDAREVRFRQERFVFRDLHQDIYAVLVVFRDGGGKETAVNRMVVVS